MIKPKQNIKFLLAILIIAFVLFSNTAFAVPTTPPPTPPGVPFGPLGVLIAGLVAYGAKKTFKK